MKSAVVLLLAALAALMWSGAHDVVSAQTATTGIRGVIYELRTYDTSHGPPGPPVPNARIAVEPLGLTTTSAADGTFAILGIDWDTVPKYPPPPAGTRTGMVPEIGRVTVLVEAAGLGAYKVINMPIYEGGPANIEVWLTVEPQTRDETCIPTVIAALIPGCLEALSGATAPTTGGGSGGPSAPIAFTAALALIAAALLGAGLARRRRLAGGRRWRALSSS